MFTPWYPDNMCLKMWEHIFIYTTKRLDSSSSLLLHWEQFLNLKWSYDIPLSEIMIWWSYTWFIGDVDGSALQSKSMDSLGQQFLDLLEQASWCHVGMARSLWLHRCGMVCHRLWCWGILLNSWHGRNSWSLFHLGCQCCGCSICGLHVWCRWGWCRLCC